MLLVASGPTARQHAPDKPGGGISRVSDHCFCWLLAWGGPDHTGAPSMLQMLLARMGEVRRLIFFLSLRCCCNLLARASNICNIDGNPTSAAAGLVAMDLLHGHKPE